jgi:hypothetical protein
MVVVGLVALVWGLLQHASGGLSLPEQIPEDLDAHVDAAGTTTVDLEPGPLFVVATGPGLLSLDASGPDVGLVGSDLTSPDITLTAPDGSTVALTTASGSLLVQGGDGRPDAQSLAVVDIVADGPHVLTVGEPTAPVEGIGLVAVDDGSADDDGRLGFVGTFAGATLLILGVLVLVLRLGR